MEDQDGPSITEKIIDLIVIIMDICIVMGNSFILFVVIKNWNDIRRSRKNRAAHLLTVNLCGADLLLATIDIYYMLTHYVPELSAYLIQHKIPCLVTLSSYVTSHMASGFTLVAIAVERYIYIVHGIRYAKLMGSRRTLFMLSVVWCAAILGTLPLYNWNNWNGSNECRAVNIIPKIYSMVATVGRIVFIIVVIFILHCRIHCKALRIHERAGPLCTRDLFRTRSARVVVIISTVYVISWIPFITVFCCKRFGVDVPSLSFNFAESLITINYLVNPFIYALHNRPIQNAIMKAITKLKKNINLCRNNGSREDSLEPTTNSKIMTLSSSCQGITPSRSTTRFSIDKTCMKESQTHDKGLKQGNLGASSPEKTANNWKLTVFPNESER